MSEIAQEKIKKAEQVLIDNGIDPDEAQTVLQALGYVLLDEELYPECAPDEAMATGTEMVPVDNIRILSADDLDMQFFILREGLDIEEAAMSACRDYINETRSGWKEWVRSGFCFGWAEFWSSVPDQICEKHGFRKLLSSNLVIGGTEAELPFSESDVCLTETQKTQMLEYAASAGREDIVKILDCAGWFFGSDEPDETLRDEVGRALDNLIDFDQGDLMSFYRDRVDPERK